MSAISGSGNGTQGIFQYLQSLSGSQSTAQTASTGDATTSNATTGGDASSALQGMAGGHHHHGGGKGGHASAFFGQIQSAVTSALQSAQSSGSTSDPNEVIQNAIAAVFKNQQNITGGTTGQTGSTGSTSDASNTGSASSSSDTATANSTANSAFAQLLQANGVDPEQFHSDFLSAIQSAQNGGSADPGSIFANLPTGSVVDTFA